MTIELDKGKTSSLLLVLRYIAMTNLQGTELHKTTIMLLNEIVAQVNGKSTSDLSKDHPVHKE